MDFGSLSRRQLQALCKQHKIPANTTNVAMAAALRELAEKGGCAVEIPAAPTPCKPPMVAVTPARITRSQAKKQPPQQEPSAHSNAVASGNRKLFVEDPQLVPAGSAPVSPTENPLLLAPGPDKSSDKRGVAAEELPDVTIQAFNKQVDASSFPGDLGHLHDAPPAASGGDEPPGVTQHFLEDQDIDDEQEAEKAAPAEDVLPVAERQLNRDSREVEQLSCALSAVTLGDEEIKANADKENLPLGFERFSLRQLKKFQKELYEKKMRKAPLSPNVIKNNRAHE